MLISIWNYLRGYVMIEIAGFSAERFLNLVTYRGIYVWDVRRYGTKVTMKVGISGYKLLKPCAKKTGCRIKILEKRGLPFFTHRYRKRKMLPIGLFLFVALIYVMSSFVWLVEVKGNERVLTQDIVERLSQNGYKIGSWKYKMNLRAAEQIIMQDFSDILWVGISFEGTKLIVELTEIVLAPEEIDYSEPCDIVAKSDALILQIVTRKGTPMVKAGDIIRKGDILVSGEVPIAEEGQEGEKRYVHASADIVAKTHYNISGKIGMERKKKAHTGELTKQYSLKLFNKIIGVYTPKIKFANYDYIVKSHQLQVTSKFPLPFYWIVEEYIEYNPEVEIISEEVAQDKLTALLFSKLEDIIHTDGEVISQQILFEQVDNTMIGRLQAIVKEELGIEVPLQIIDGKDSVYDESTANN